MCLKMFFLIWQKYQVLEMLTFNAVVAIYRFDVKFKLTLYFLLHEKVFLNFVA